MIYVNRPLIYRGVNKSREQVLFYDGAEIPLDLFDELVVMRHAELVRESQRLRLGMAMRNALAHHSQNMGCDALSREAEKPVSREIIAKRLRKRKSRRKRNYVKAPPERHYQLWDEADLIFVRDHPEMTTGQLSRILGRTRNTISVRRWKIARGMIVLPEKEGPEFSSEPPTAVPSFSS